MAVIAFKQLNNKNFCLYSTEDADFIAFNLNEHHLILRLLERSWSEINIRCELERVQRSMPRTGNYRLERILEKLSPKKRARVIKLMDSYDNTDELYFRPSIYCYPIKQPNGQWGWMNDVWGYPPIINLSEDAARDMFRSVWGNYFSDTYLSRLMEHFSAAERWKSDVLHWLPLSNMSKEEKDELERMTSN